MTFQVSTNTIKDSKAVNNLFLIFPFNFIAEGWIFLRLKVVIYDLECVYHWLHFVSKWKRAEMRTHKLSIFCAINPYLSKDFLKYKLCKYKLCKYLGIKIWKASFSCFFSIEKNRLGRNVLPQTFPEHPDPVEGGTSDLVSPKWPQRMNLQ